MAASKKPVSKVFYIVLGGMILSVFIPFLTSVMNPNMNRPRPLGLSPLQHKTDFWKIIQQPRKFVYKGGPNTWSVGWVVYFYKPYCGASRRMRPLLEGLGNTVNASNHLRFAALDCVEHRHVCDRAGIESFPRVRIYSTTPESLQSSLETGSFERVPVAEWSGRLVLTELLAWFKIMQTQGHIHQDVGWPQDENLAKAILDYKGRGEARVEGLVAAPALDPGGYLQDIESAMKLSLVDHIFPSMRPLTGGRLNDLTHYIQVLSRIYPQDSVRAELRSLGSRISARLKWSQVDYEAEMAEFGATMSIAKDTKSWEWCRPRESGRGGYSCGMWLLFHTMVANSDRYHAEDTLQTIHSWVQNFFGCQDCSSHFQAMWEREQGDTRRSHQEVALWLWSAHNMVNDRLTGEDDSNLRLQWPPVEMCPECYTEDARNETATGKSAVSSTSFSTHQWLHGNVFMFLQEMFCYKSDTLSCAQFYDPSDEKAFESVFKWTAVVLFVVTLGVVGCCVWVITAPTDQEFATDEHSKLVMKTELQDDLDKKLMKEILKMKEEKKAHAERCKLESTEIKKDI